MRNRLKSFPVPLALILGVAAVLSLSWNVATAPLQAPDEFAHVAYVAHLAETGSIPNPDVGRSPFGADQELALYQLNLASILQNPAARPDWSDSQIKAFERAEQRLTAEQKSSGVGPNGVARNPPLYYSAEAAVWKLTPGGFFARVFTLRLLSGLIFLALVAFTWLVAGEVLRRRLPQAVATAFVALTPMSGFLGGVVNPDIASAALWAGFLWVALRNVRLGPTALRTAALALFAVAAILTHGRNLAILPLLGIALVVAWAYRRPPLKTILTGAASAGATLAAGGLMLLLLAKPGGGGTYGGMTNVNDAAAFNLRQFLSSIWQFYLPKLNSMDPSVGQGYGFRQFFIEQFFGGDFASHEVFFPYGIYDTVQVVVVLLAIASYTALVLNWRTVVSRWPAATILGAAAGGLLLFLHLASYRALIGGGDPLITGRYLLPIAVVFGLALAAIVAALPRRWAPPIAAIVTATMFILALSAVGLSFQRFYA